MTISLQQLKQLQCQPTIVIHSLDPVLYQATADLEGVQHLITDEQGAPLRTFNLTDMKRLLADIPLQALWLSHQSAYDEMVGQPTREATNQLLVPLDVTTNPPSLSSVH